MAQFLPQPQGGTQEPITVQIDPEWCADFVWSRAGHRRLEPYASLHSVLKELLKEFLNPPRTSDPGADFFAVYRKESNDFDRDYAARCDEDFNTTLVFVSCPIFVLVAENRTQRYPGWSIICSQHNIRRQRPAKT